MKELSSSNVIGSRRRHARGLAQASSLSAPRENDQLVDLLC
jgi:hypothetical protein